MSVATLGTDEFADAATTIWYSEELKRVFLSFRERYIELACTDRHATCVTRTDVLSFVERLYLANRMAAAYQYPDMCPDGVVVIERLSEQDLEGSVLPPGKLLAALRDIHYNLYTNSGRCFLGSEDMERLERLMTACREHLLDTVEAVQEW